MAEETIDKLKIDIKSDTSDTESKLSKLMGMLNSISSLQSKIESSTGNDIKGKLTELADGLKAVSSINASKLQDATKAIRQFSNVDFSSVAFNLAGMGNVSRSVGEFSDAMRAVAEVPDMSGGIKNIRALGNVDLTGFVNSVLLIPPTIGDRLTTLAEAFGEFTGAVDAGALRETVRSMNELSTFDFGALSANINSISPDAVNRLREFFGAFSSIPSGLGEGLTSMQNLFSGNYDAFITFMENANSVLPEFIQNMTGLSAVGASPDMTDAAANLEKIGSIDFSKLKGFKLSDLTSAKSSANTEDLFESIFGKMTPSFFEKFGYAITKIGSAIGTVLSPAVKALKAVFTGLQFVVTKTAKVLLVAFTKPLQAVTSLAKLGLKPLVDKFKNAASHSNKFLKSIIRIAGYRAIRTALSQITKGFKEGTDNLYQYSKAIDGRFTKSMDMISTSMLYLHNSIGAAAAPIINRLAPAFDILIDKIVESINIVNQLAAKLTGASTWTKALKYPKEYAEATDAASKSMKDFTMGFDELNIISDTKGGDTSQALDYSQMFTEVKLDRNFQPWIDDFKAAIENSDWYGAGVVLGNKFNEVFANLPYEEWGSIIGTDINNAISLANGFFDTAKFEEVGSGIARFLNNAFENIDFYELGRLLSAKWNIIIDTLHGFVTEFEFSDFGTKLAEAANGWFANIHWDTLGETIHLGLMGILSTFDSFLENLQTKDWGNSLAQIINNINIDEILGKVASVASNFAIKTFNLFSGFLQGTDWKKLGTDLFNSIGNVLANIKWGEIASSFAEFLGSALGAAGALIWGFFKTAVEKGEKLGEKLYDWLEEVGGFGSDGFWKGIKDAFVNAYTWVKEHIFTPFLDGFKKAFGINSPSTVMAEMGGYVIAGLKNGITTAWTKVKDWVEEHIFNPFVNGFKALFGINSPSTVMEGFGGNIVEGLKNGITNTWNTVTDFFSTGLDDIKSMFNNFDIGTAFVDTFENLKNGIVSVFDNLPDNIKGGVNGAIASVEFMIDTLFSGFRSMANVLNSYQIDIPDWVPGIGGQTFSLNLPIWGDTAFKLPRFDKGGFPESGELFFANENGNAEMIGRIGSQTAVANNDQIVRAISEGVAQAVRDVLGDGSRETPVNVQVFIGTKEITEEVETRQKTRGVTLFSGGVVNAH